MHRLPTGKVPPRTLVRAVYRYLGVKDERVILGPSIGEDAALIDMGDRVLVLTSDPITGAVENIGWLSVHVNANDVATRGARPRWYLCSILLPDGAEEPFLEDIMKQVDQAACELEVSVVGGHSEVSPGLSRPVVVGSMVGETAKNRFVSSSGAKLGDKIILTKGAGIEGTAILATDLPHLLKAKLGEETLVRAKAFIKKISIVKEAMVAMDVGGVDAMHDPTEGGLIAGVWELAEAAKVGVQVSEEQVQVEPETRAVCDLFQIDPLQTISSGALLIVVKPDRAEALQSSLRREGIAASVIGVILKQEEGRRLIKKSGETISLVPPEQDHLYKVLNRFGGRDKGGIWR